MRTAQWQNYTGPGRIAVSPVPQGTRRGYRLSPVLFVGSSPSLAEIQAGFAVADAHAVWRQLHVLTYPHEPVLMGTAPAEAGSSYRLLLARWLGFFVGEEIPELNPETHRPRKQRMQDLHLGSLGRLV